MKKYLLFLLFCLIDLSAFCQSNKINKQDSVPYHFSIKNGWALKINALQLLTEYECRIYLEKKITKNTSVEVFGSYYYADYSLADFYWVERLGLGYLNYARKIGVGYKMYSRNKNPHVTTFEFFYKYFERANYGISTTPFNSSYPANYNEYDYYNSFCLQWSEGKKIELKRFICEFYCGAGMRVRFLKSFNSNNFNTYSQWHLAPGALGICPSLQLGVNIGIQSK
ncbi:MAG: hypothetical protein RJA07_1714 [Bacteroidota bacterium]|jgi:hypothetical protein